MIIPNLIVGDVARSAAFYRDVVGLDVIMVLGPGEEMIDCAELPERAVFVTLQREGAQLFLQSQSHAESVLAGASQIAPSWIYIRDLEPEPVLERAGAALVSGPKLTWYGMNEIHLRDPDGHIVCVGAPSGPGPKG